MKTGILFTLFILLSSQLISSAPDSTSSIKYSMKARIIRVFKGQKWAERYETNKQFNEYLNNQDFQNAVELITDRLLTLDSLENDYKMNTAGFFHGLRGYAQYFLMNYDVAMNDVNRAIEVVPNWSRGYYFRGLIHYQLGDYQAALDDYTQAIEDKHKHRRKVDNHYYFARGDAYCWALGQFENAISDYTKCIKMKPKWALPYLHRGSARQLLQDYTGAIADYEKGIALDPYLIIGYQNLAGCYYKQKDYDAAIKVTMDGLHHFPDNPYLYQMAGGFYLAKGDNPQAIIYFTKCLEINSNDSLTLIMNRNDLRPLIGISVANYNIGDKENSRKYYDQAREIQPFFDNALEGIEEMTTKCSPFLEQEKKTLRLMVEEFKDP